MMISLGYESPIPQWYPNHPLGNPQDELAELREWLAAPEGAKDEHRRIAGLRCLMPLRLPSGRIGSQQEIYCGTPEFEKTIYYVTYYVTYYSVMISVPGSWLFLGTSLARSPGSQTRLAGSGLAMGNLQKNPTMNCTIQVGYYDYLMIITIAYRNYILN
jgi:hypothetical protein